LKDTGQLQAQPEPKAEAGAFVISARDGRAEQQLDTLPEAVRQARSGDTIEVRGNGPFVLDPICIDNLELHIRAGAGFRPVFHVGPGHTQIIVRITAKKAATVASGVIVSNSLLALEGLEFLQPSNQGWPFITCCGPLYVANCRLTAHNQFRLL